MNKNYTSPSGEGSPVVSQYNYSTGQYMRPNYYGEHMAGLETEINNRNTRMGRKGYAPTPNYMIGNGNSPMHRGGNNLFPSPQQGFSYLTTGGDPPPSAMPQNTNVYPAMFNHQTGQRIDPQSGGLVPYAPKIDKHSSSIELDAPSFSGLPSYLKSHSDLGSTMPYRDVSGSGGYRYRQYADGSIQILQSPQGGVGTMVSKSSPYWQPITNQIGAYPSSAPSTPIQTGNQRADAILERGRQLAQSEQGQNLISSLFDRLVAGQSAQTEQQKLLAEQARLEQQRIQEQMQPSFFEKSKPYIIGLSIMAVAGGFTYALTKKGK